MAFVRVWIADFRLPISRECRMPNAEFLNEKRQSERDSTFAGHFIRHLELRPLINPSCFRL
jgi:hypothetical protein